MNLSVSVVIPTLNRPLLLYKALESLLSQSRQADEIIVVDDGSTPPVDAHELVRAFGDCVALIRHDEPRGLAYARNAGVERATGELVAHLDDDDLYHPDTLAEAINVFTQHPTTQVIFLGVEGFGRAEAHFNKVQGEGVAQLVRLAGESEIEPGVVRLGRGLMGSVLRSVPSALQHVVIRKRDWARVNELRWKAYQLRFHIGDPELVRRRIAGQLRDSEWVMYAAACLDHAVLINKARYLARCDGQNTASLPANREKHVRQLLEIKQTLHEAAKQIPDLEPYRRPIHLSAARMGIDAAYHFIGTGNRSEAARCAIYSLAVRPSWAATKLLFRSVLFKASR